MRDDGGRKNFQMLQGTPRRESGRSEFVVENCSMPRVSAEAAKMLGPPKASPAGVVEIPLQFTDSREPFTKAGARR